MGPVELLPRAFLLFRSSPPINVRSPRSAFNCAVFVVIVVVVATGVGISTVCSFRFILLKFSLSNRSSPITLFCVVDAFVVGGGADASLIFCFVYCWIKLVIK